MASVLAKSLTLRGFIQREFAQTHFEDFLADMSAWVRSGEVRYREDITEGLDRAHEGLGRPGQSPNDDTTVADLTSARGCAPERAHPPTPAHLDAPGRPPPPPASA